MAADRPADFGEVLRRFRLAARLSQDELSERAGMGAHGISELERGAGTSPSPATLRRLAEALGLSSDEQAQLRSASRLGPDPEAHTESDMAFARILRRARQEANLTQAALAERAGLSTRAVEHLEQGRGHPYRHTAERLADALELRNEARVEFQLAATRKVRVPEHSIESRSDARQPRRTNVLVPLTSFIGREREVRAVTDQLRSSAVRLLTLIGPGGTGKTRLALAVAANTATGFPDGTFVVELAALADPELVPAAIASVLDVREAPGEAMVDTLQRRLADLDLLLVMDNFEHLLPGAHVIQSLLQGCPRLKVLATSRTPLGLYGEREFPVTPLSLPDLQHGDVETIDGAESVRLFVERARANQPEFEINAANARTVGEICVQLDGLPLAIELGAARLRVLPPKALLNRLEHRLHILTGGTVDRPARHHTLRAMLDWSYDLLNPTEQVLFAQLAVFAGGWTLDAAEAVCTGDGQHSINVLDDLEGLVRASLVQKLDSDPEGRFGMLETVREYARERLLVTGEHATLRRSHAAHYIALAEAAAPHLRSPQQAGWMARLAREHENLRAAFGWCAEYEQAEMGVRLAAALWRFWENSGYLREGRARMSEVLALHGSEGDQAVPSAARAMALRGAARLAWLQGDWPAADSLARESFDVARCLGDKSGIAAALNELAIVAMNFQRDNARARALLEEALELWREVGAELDVGVALNNLGQMAWARGDLPVARSMLEESRAIHEGAGDIIRMANGPLLTLGWVAQDQGEYATAQSIYQEALAIGRDLRDSRGVIYALQSLAALAADVGQPTRALRLAGAVSRFQEEIGGEFEIDPQTQSFARIESARAVLGTDPAAAAWADGRALSLDDAIAEGLDESKSPAQPGRAANCSEPAQET